MFLEFRLVNYQKPFCFHLINTITDYSDTFIEYPNKNCLPGNELHALSDVSSADGFAECRLWCATNKDCGAFVAFDNSARCWLKESGCQENLYQADLDPRLAVYRNTLVK